MSVKLREKKIKDGQVSFYLDIYHEGSRWYEFLNIKINPKKPTPEDKEKKRLASEIRTSREHELIVQDNNLIDKRKKNILFTDYFDKKYKVKDENGKRREGCAPLYFYALKYMEDFAGKTPLTISKITAQWLRGYEKYLVERMSNNTARGYVGVIVGGLNEALRERIINRNPWHDLAKHEKIKKQDIFRTALTFEQLEMLANTPFKWEEQFRLAYFFDCFAGLRWSDLNCLKWSEIIIRQIDGAERWFMYFEQEKTEGIEYLPLTPQAIEILRERKRKAMEEGNKSPYVFPKLKESSHGSPVVQRYRRALKSWAKAAKKKYKDAFTLEPADMYPHNARHTFATNMLETGAQGDILLVSKLLGHKCLQSTQVYTHVREQRKMKAVDNLPKINLKIVHSTNKKAA